MKYKYYWQKLVVLCAFSVLGLNRSWAQNSMPAGETAKITSLDRLDGDSDHNWFTKNYADYKYDTTSIKSLKKISADYWIVAVGGTWCGDTHRELPKFYKVIDDSGISREKVKLYFVDRDYKSPELKGKKYKIKKVPTFIVFKGEKEIGRIVEKPQKSIEADLAKLIQ